MKILKGTIIGGIVLFFLGWIVYGLVLESVMASSMNACANRPNNEMVWWAMILSCFAYAALLTLILRWAGAVSWMDGLKIGALVGFLFALYIDLNFYSMTTMFNNLGGMVADIAASTFNNAVTGALIVLLWGKEKA